MSRSLLATVAIRHEQPTDAISFWSKAYFWNSGCSSRSTRSGSLAGRRSSAMARYHNETIENHCIISSCDTTSHKTTVICHRVAILKRWLGSQWRNFENSRRVPSAASVQRWQQKWRYIKQLFQTRFNVMSDTRRGEKCCPDSLTQFKGNSGSKRDEAPRLKQYWIPTELPNKYVRYLLNPFLFQALSLDFFRPEAVFFDFDYLDPFAYRSYFILLT